MNRRVCVWIGSVLGCALIGRVTGFGEGQLAFAQASVASAPPPSPAVMAAANTAAANSAVAILVPLQNLPTITPAQRTGTIAPFIDAQIAALSQPASPAVTVARLALMYGCPRQGNVPGTANPGYQAAYASALSTAAVKLLSAPTTPLQVKISLGVVVERVATNSQTQALVLMPAVQKLLADRADSVVYWGCKAARPLVLALILQQNPPANPPLFGNIVDAVKNHPAGDMGGFIATEAYRALVVNPNNVPGTPAAQVKPLLRPLYDPVLKLFALRTAMYNNGVPPAPDAEQNVPTFLTTTVPPPIYTPAQKASAVQDLVNVIDVAGQRAAAITNPQQLTQMKLTAQYAASALNVFSGTTLLSKVSQMPPGITGPQMSNLCSTVFPLMSGPFPALKKPPTLPPLPPTTAPAGAPPAAGK